MGGVGGVEGGKMGRCGRCGRWPREVAEGRCGGGKLWEVYACVHREAWALTHHEVGGEAGGGAGTMSDHEGKHLLPPNLHR